MHWNRKLFFVLLLLPLLFACAPRYASLAEAEAAGAVFAAGVSVDGVPLQGMRVAEARAALASRQSSLRVFTSDGAVEIPHASLPAQWNREEVLLQAVNSRKPCALACTAVMHTEACRAALQPFLEPLCVTAENAQARYANGEFVYTEAAAGRMPDVQHLADSIAATLAQAPEAPAGHAPIRAEVVAVPPAYTRAQAEADTSLLSSFTTSFAKGDYDLPNRVHNISKAAALLDGVRVESGETLDMNALLGPRNGENGWKEATAIRDGAYTQEYGGGVCQVSTTLYNAVLLADLTVTQRAHHSWPLGYIAAGRDATISTGGPNFCFRNDTLAPVYVSARVDEAEKTVTVRLFGRARTDGLRIELSAKKVESLPDPGDEIRLDRSLAAGTRREMRPSRAGSVCETHKLYYNAQDEVVKKERVSRDTYRPVKGIVYVAQDLYGNGR